VDQNSKSNDPEGMEGSEENQFQEIKPIGSKKPSGKKEDQKAERERPFSSAWAADGVVTRRPIDASSFCRALIR
jgi:hypothetical protein